MDTCGKSNAEFHFDQVNATLQVVLIDIQALRITHNLNTNSPEINPFANKEFSHQQPTHPYPINNHQHHNLKLFFPKFNREDPS